MLSMGRAVEQLQGEQTKDALPHEMAALQGAPSGASRNKAARGDAAANNRRRWIGPAGAGPVGALRQGTAAAAANELRSRSQIEERPDQKNQDDALDRIRDLARRQEELSRQRRELANARRPRRSGSVSSSG